VSTTRILYWCGAYNGLFAIVGNLLLQKWGISFATLAYFILQHIVLSLLRFKEDIKLDKKVPTEILEAMGVSDIKSSSPRISQYNKLLQGGVDIERRVI
jgi:hypothetical protein